MKISTRSDLFPPLPWYFGLPCGLAGLGLLGLIMASGGSSLALGAFSARAAACVLLLLFAVLAVCLLRWEGCSSMTVLFFLLPTAAALYLRLLCLDHQTHDYQTFLVEWAAFFRDNGGFAALKQSVGDYNVPYLYFLAAISYLPVPDLYLIKLLSILFDILLSWAGLRLCRQFCRKDSIAPLICFTMLLFLPTVILNGSYWAQCDSLYCTLVLLALSSVWENRPKTSVVLLALAFAFKLQAVFLIPLWCAFWFSGRVKFRHFFLFPAAYAVAILPALALGKPLREILGVYLGQMAEYGGYLTLNAPSVFAFLPYGAQVNTSLASALGITCAFMLVFFLLAVLLWQRKQINDQILLTAAVILAIGVPFLLPNMHERYFFPADVITLAWACSDRRRIPVALLVQVSSLSSYHTYLALQYTLPIYLGGQYYVMAFEAALMLCAWIWSVAALIRQVKATSFVG